MECPVHRRNRRRRQLRLSSDIVPRNGGLLRVASVLTASAEPAVTADQKNMAKPVNFGLCFGMASKTLVLYARKNFNVVLTEAQADEFKQKFLEHYAGVRAWQEKTAREMPLQLRTRSGRVSYYLFPDEGYNARLSFPIQGTAADGMKAAIVLLHPQLARLGARIILVVHDELVVEAPEEHAEEVRVLMRDCMITGMQTYVTSVPILVEPEVRSTWAG
jgi:DNA polymerase-1